ncbi:TerC family protein [Dinghuibacter silviterrae]|uniref:Tellurite resistance protein TerC n=1 Tax=Dinghuibacter silviterrae TaxID=1539049 RepID=A0A4V6Q9Y2_9BACT|nr:tellurium resistance protein TerC [Dinghuibacter silviterrae]TDW99352.1 tellurite resistance protein TerC [Dinghuibacter silviterrae]
MTLRRALVQTFCWVLVALAFGVVLWRWKGSDPALEYATAYITEWSLSVDNIFVFVLLFRFFQVGEREAPKILTAGIGLAIVFRILFIAGGLALVTHAHWVLYVFGAFLVYTGIKMFSGKHQAQVNPKVHRFLQRFFKNPLLLVIVLLAVTDIVFAMDSIPAVLAISTVPLVVYSSNIFAVLGLRSLFFLLKGAVDRFRYLQQGVAVVLVFIGGKMLADMIQVRLPDWVSLTVIALCLGGSIVLSLSKNNNA